MNCRLIGALVFSVGILATTAGMTQSVHFQPLFNGRNLDGWYGIESLNPLKMQAMTPAELQAEKMRFHSEMESHWTVENSELVNDGSGPFLTTEREFSDFELKLEYRTVANADSGIYLKATPQVQIWDSTEAGGKWDIGARLGSGGLWNNDPLAAGRNPLVLADKPFGQWNRLRILQIGARTSVWLNDQLVVDHAIMQNYWDPKLPLAKRGPIQLQTHGGEIRWRDIVIREIGTDEANRLLASKHGDGFVSIFNGSDFDGWTGPIDNYQIVDEILLCRPGKGGTIFTDREYADFAVRFEFKLPPQGNNGLAIRYPGQGDTAYVGMCELQILGDDYPGDLDPRQLHGSAYGMVAAATGYLRKNGEWNFQEVTVKGPEIKVELNGSVILETDLSTVHEFLVDQPHPGKERTKGHFGFAGHNDPVGFRRIAIKELD